MEQVLRTRETDSTSGSTLAANVRAEVARQRVKQADLAAALGINQRSVSRRLLGHTEFTATELQQLAAFLDVPVADLLDTGP